MRRYGSLIIINPYWRQKRHAKTIKVSSLVTDKSQPKKRNKAEISYLKL